MPIGPNMPGSGAAAQPGSRGKRAPQPATTPAVPVRIPGTNGPPPIPPEFEKDESRVWRKMPMLDRLAWAGQNLKTALILYRKLNGEFIRRIVEPYSYRMLRPQRPAPEEAGKAKSKILKRLPKAPGLYFFGYDLTGTPSIKSFLVRKILHVDVNEASFFPRWDVEF